MTVGDQDLRTDLVQWFSNLNRQQSHLQGLLKTDCWLFTIAGSWKQPKCPWTDEWIKKMWYIYTKEYYSAIKMNEIGSFVETWMDLETVIQSEVSQKEKNIYRILSHVCGI